MKFRVVSSKDEIDGLSGNEQMIHLAFRASNVDIFRLLQICPQVRAIQLPASYRKTVSQAGEMFLKIQGVELIEGDLWDHPKDLNEYFIIDEGIMRRIDSMISNGWALEDVVSAIAGETKMSPDLVSYVIRMIN
ncbi:MAG: DUF1699 family protein [Methanotrichaceae archaeon]|nr:DUF1699 family protein [Methanotrichaceae archaeon]